MPPVQSQKAATPTTATNTSKIEAIAIEEVVSFVAAKGFVFDPVADRGVHHGSSYQAVRDPRWYLRDRQDQAAKAGCRRDRRTVPPHPSPAGLDRQQRTTGLRTARQRFDVRSRSLAACRQGSSAEPDQQFFVLLDEMNVARVEYYLAEVLSHIEEREAQADGTIASDPLVPNASDD